MDLCAAFGALDAGAGMNARFGLSQALFLLVVALVYVFLMLPIAIVVILSFNAAQSLSFPPQGFSLRWYFAFFGSKPFMGQVSSCRCGWPPPRRFLPC